MAVYFLYEAEAGESESEETNEELDSLSKELKELKTKLEDLKVKYPEDTNEEVAKALDDATSAIDLAVHHLDDIEEDLPSEEMSGELEGGEHEEVKEEWPEPESPVLGESSVYTAMDNVEPIEAAHGVEDNPYPDVDTQMDVDTVVNSEVLRPSEQSVLQAYLTHGAQWRLIAADLKIPAEKARQLFDSAISKVAKTFNIK